MQGHMLKHNDRIMIGNSIFLFKHPAEHDVQIAKEKKEAEEKGEEYVEPEDTVDWDVANEEKNQKTDEAEKQEIDKQMKIQEEIHHKREEEMKKREAEMEDSMKNVQKEKEDLQEQIREEIRREYEQKMKVFEQETEEYEIHRHQEDKILEDKLIKWIPMINEANLCASEFGKDVHFDTKLIRIIPDSFAKFNTEQVTETYVEVSNNDYGEKYLWSSDKFYDRLLVMRDLVNIFFQTNELPKLKPVDDPFYDEPEP